MPFQLARLTDTVHIHPAEFSKPLTTAVTEALNEKYPNKVLDNVGLCVAIHDILTIGESILYQGNAAQHTTVVFRLVVFKPFVGEVLSGTVVSCDRQGLRLSMGFFDEIRVPSGMLPDPSSWSDEEQLWVWNVTPEDRLFIDLENKIRFRAAQVSFSHQKTPSGETGLGEVVVPTMIITGALDKSGLGLLSWWPPAEEEEEKMRGGIEEAGIAEIDGDASASIEDEKLKQ